MEGGRVAAGRGVVETEYGGERASGVCEVTGCWGRSRLLGRVQVGWEEGEVGRVSEGRGRGEGSPGVSEVKGEAF